MGHSHCRHQFKFCAQCDMVWCGSCSKEWGGHAHQNYWWTTPHYTNLTSTTMAGTATGNDIGGDDTFTIAPLASHANAHNSG